MDAGRIESLLKENKADEAISALENWQKEGGKMDDNLYYLLGNAWRKKGNWQMAINQYLEAVRINPGSPAASALTMANDILDFYNKDLYNP